MSLPKKKRTQSKKPSSTRKQRMSIGKFHAADYSTTELEAIAAARAPEAYRHATGEWSVPSGYRTIARKELISRTGLGPMKQFKGKSTLTESEVRKLGKLLNEGKIRPFELRENGYALGRTQQDKGIDFLRKHFMKKYKRDEGCYREMKALGWDEKKKEWKAKHSTNIKLRDFYADPIWSKGKLVGDRFYPLYDVDGHDASFEYWYGGGKLSLTG